jgi:hypothetical protein
MYAVLMTEKDHQGNFNNFPFEDCDFWVEQITDKDTIAEHGEGNAVHVIVEHPDYVLKKRFISAFIATRRWGFGRADMPLLDEEQFQLLGL